MLTDEQIDQFYDSIQGDDQSVFHYGQFARAIEQAARAQMAEEAAECIDAINDSAGDRASYDNREMYESERACMYALSDAAAAIRALATEKS